MVHSLWCMIFRSFLWFMVQGLRVTVQGFIVIGFRLIIPFTVQSSWFKGHGSRLVIQFTVPVFYTVHG